MVKEQSLRRETKEDFAFDALKKVVDLVAETFGPRCEVVLHDLRDLRNLDHSIIKIANGHVTGRTDGGPMSDRGLRDLRSGPEWDFSINYASVTNDGRALKSSTMLLRNNKGKPIAALCINFDITDIVNLNGVVQDIFRISDSTQQDKPCETFEVDMVSTLNKMADEIIRKTGKSVVAIGKEDRIGIVRQLDEQGFFVIKGGIKLIASKLKVSKFSIYNYLEQARAMSSSSNSKILN